MSSCSANEVFVYDLDSDNQLLDWTPDYVLGGAPVGGPTGLNQHTMICPGGLAFDATNNRLFVSGYWRLMVYDLSGGITDNMNASHVLGAPSFSLFDGCGSGYPTAASLCMSVGPPPSLAYDPSTDYLYATDDSTDSGDSRVLVFDTTPGSIADGEDASYVLGKPDFTTKGGDDVEQDLLTRPTGLAIDTTRQLLFVADEFITDRVLVFDLSSLSSGEDASYVIGEPDFTSDATAVDAGGDPPDAKSFVPDGLAYDPDTERLFVQDQAGNRVLVFDVSSLSDYPDATYVLGSPDLTTVGDSCGSDGFCFLNAGNDAFDTDTGQLYASDEGAGTVDIFDTAADSPSPSATLTVCGTTPVLSAQSGSGSSASYEFQIATSDTFSGGSIVADSGMIPATSTFTPPPGALTEGTPYYWHWKTNLTSYSDPESFTITLPHLGGGQSGQDNSPQWSDGPLAVNEVSGNLLVSYDGPSFPTDANPLAASVSYNSDSPADMGLGTGWLLNVGATSTAPTRLIDHSLLLGSNRLNAVEAQYADGSSACFNRIGDTDTFVPPPGTTARLVEAHRGGFTYTDGETVASYATANGTGGIAEPTQIVDLAANSGKGILAYTFSTTDPTKITSIEDDSGRSLTFTWNTLDSGDCPDAILCISGPDGQEWQYVGNANSGTGGSLTTINDGSRDIAAISYNGNGLVDELQNANDLDAAHASPGYDDAHALAIDYDSSSPKKVTSISDGPVSDQTPSTATWTFAYHGSTTTNAPMHNHDGITTSDHRTAAGYTTITPPNQQSAETPTYSTVYWDGEGNPIERTDILGNTTLAGYTADNQLLWTEDEDGNPTDYTYDSTEFDSADDVVASSEGPDAGNGRPTTTYRYDETAIGDSTTPGPATQGLQGFYYTNQDLAGIPSLIETDPNIDFDWASSEPAGLGDPGDFSVVWAGEVKIDAGEAGDYTFTTVADAGTELSIDGKVAIDNWTEQSAGTPVASAAVSLTAGWHRIELDYYGHESTAQVELEWACGGCSTPISAEAIPEASLQPAWLNETSTVSPLGRVSYSHFNQPWTGNPQYTEQLGSIDGGSDTPLVTSYTYDDYGRIAGKVLPSGNASPSFSTDDASYGDLESPPDPASSDYGTSYSYYGPSDTAPPPEACGGGDDVNQGGLLETRSEHGLHDITYVYDDAGNTIATTDHAGTTCDTYNDESELTSQQLPGDTNPTTYTYDPAGNVLTETHTPVSGDDTAGTITTDYDEANRVEDTTDAAGATATFAYDGDGNVLSRIAGGTAQGDTETPTLAHVTEWDNTGPDLASLTSPEGYPSAKGDLLVLSATQFFGYLEYGGTATITSVSGGGVTTWHKATSHTGSDDLGSTELWYGTVTSTGSSTLLVNWDSTPPGSYAEFAVDEYSTSNGNWSLSDAGSAVHESASTNVAFPSLTTPATGTSLYTGYGYACEPASGGSTSGFTFETSGFDDPIPYDTDLAPSTAYAPVATQSPSDCSLAVGAIFTASPAGPYTTDYTYNDADQLTTQTDPAGQSYDFFYDKRGNLQGTQYPNGTYSWTDTNPLGETTDVLNQHGTIDDETASAPTDPSPISDESYVYNLDGQQTAKIDGLIGDSYEGTVLNDHPVAYYRLDQSSGTGAADSSGNGNTGTYVNTPTFGATGLVAGSDDATSLAAASDEYGKFPTTPSTPTLTGSFTVEAWVKLASTPGPYTLFSSVAPNNYGIDAELTSSGLHVELGDGTSWLTTSANSSYSWTVGHTYEIAIVVSGATWKEYVNGSEIGSGSTGGTALLWDADHRLLFGGNPTASQYLDGTIDEVAAYPTALTSTQITSHYSTGSADTTSYQDTVTAQTPIVDYQLDDSSGTTISDSSGNGNDGDYVNSPTLNAQGLISGEDSGINLTAIDDQYGEFPETPSSSTLSGAFTIEAWVKLNSVPTSTTPYPLFSSRFTPNDNSFDVQLVDYGVHADLGDGSDWRTTSADSDFTWVAGQTYQIVVVITSTTWKEYINGTQIGTGGIPSGDPVVLWDSDHQLDFGAIPYYGQYLDAHLDEISVYTSALTTGEIDTQYTAGTTTPPVTATTYQYDSAGRLQQTTPASGSCTAYQYDADGNRTEILSATQTDGGCNSLSSSSTYAYSVDSNTPPDALHSVTAGGSPIVYGYDGADSVPGDGTVTSRGSDSFTWDGGGRLQAATVSGNTACYLFSPGGGLLTRTYKTSAGNCTTPTGTTNYLLDDLFESDASGTITASYDDGLAGNLASFTGPPDTSSPTYLYYDAHGNQVATADADGDAISTESYDPWGSPVSALPSDQTTHAYVGADDKQTDSTTGLILMGARPYDSTIGRFLSVDPVDGGSLTNYDYADQDPINNYDLNGKGAPAFWSPNGHCPYAKSVCADEGPAWVGVLGPAFVVSFFALPELVEGAPVAARILGAGAAKVGPKAVAAAKVVWNERVAIKRCVSGFIRSYNDNHSPRYADKVITGFIGCVAAVK